MITSSQRGHLMYWDSTDQSWKYIDNDSLNGTERRCAQCGQLPTEEGYDACLGCVVGAKAACCGHGIEEGYVKV